MNREEGVLDIVLKEGTELRFHFFERDGGIIRRIPWHRASDGSWYSGIEGPEMRLEALRQAVGSV